MQISWIRKSVRSSNRHLQLAVLAVTAAAAHTIDLPKRPPAEPLDTSDPSFLAPEGTVFGKRYDTDPVLVDYSSPMLYPEAAISAGVEGTVILQLGIDENGRVVEVVVLQGVAGLSGAAVDAVRTWRFLPATDEGRTVAARVVIPIRFKLPD